MPFLITTSSSSALFSPAGTVSPTSSLPILSKLATPTITSLTLALSSEAEIVSSESLSAALSSVAGTVFPTPSSSILLSVQKLPPASSSSGRSLLSMPSSSVLSSTVSSFLESSGAAVEPTPTSSPSPTPAFSSAPFLASSPSPSQKLVIFSYLSIVM